ncbi:multicopper oxidase family protein [Arthrobacter sp. HLT1-20]
MPQYLNRRAFMSLSGAATAAAALAACTPSKTTESVNRILSTDPLVEDYESRRGATGIVVSETLTPAPLSTSLNGKTVSTWGYNGSFTGPTLRANVGDRLAVDLNNTLSEPTSIHWHGLALRNNHDGVQGLTEEATPAGKRRSYDFLLPHPGTYWYHSHVEMQRERALYGALIVDDPAETLHYDKDWVILLDDWMDGVTGTPDDVMKELSRGMGGMDHGEGGGGMAMGHMLMGASSDYLGGDAGDVGYPLHLFNGSTAQDPDTITAKPGERIRLRIINAAGDTAYRVGVPGQQLILTHSDGFPVQHTEVDAVVLGMGERIDAILTLKGGFTPVVALAEGKAQMVYGLVDTGTGKPPAADTLPTRFTGKVADGGKLTAVPAVSLQPRTPDSKHELRLTGGMAKYDWGINGNRFDMHQPFEHAFNIKLGQRVEVKFINDTDMWHPMHLHGHTFQVGTSGARKDTVIVRPGDTVTVYFDADNPGQWLTHCHNAYHAERGMMGVFSYVV